jgi:hypothetical protein
VTSYAADFESRGPKDSRGRSLRQLDLKTRLLKYPCSYLIYSEAFDSLMPPLKERVYRRLWEVLSGEDKSEEFQELPPGRKRAILEILIETKKNLPDYWRENAGK